MNCQAAIAPTSAEPIPMAMSQIGAADGRRSGLATLITLRGSEANPEILACNWLAGWANSSARKRSKASGNGSCARSSRTKLTGPMRSSKYSVAQIGPIMAQNRNIIHAA